MSSIIKQLSQKKLANPPSWLPDNTIYEVVMGSLAYGTSTDESDFDVYGVCVPPKEVCFPHLAGEILGFGTQKKRFEQYQQHCIFDKDALKGRGRNYDLAFYSIINYMHLLMGNNPNVLDSLFVPDDCVLFISSIGHKIRENRHLFLSKRAWHTFKGYSYSQMKRMLSKSEELGTKRKELREKHGFDTKYASHIVRLLDECEQLLTVGDLDLRKNREHLKAIRRGEVSEKEIREYFSIKEKDLEKLYNSDQCPLPYQPPEDKIKNLLLDCLEIHYGDLSKYIVRQNKSDVAISKIKEIIDEYYKCHVSEIENY